ncbi:hypothetical protein BH11ARM2_BH11ARM2_37130 [soil metagenome]
MADRERASSPFYPDQIVPPQFFVGRKSQIERLTRRGIQQTAAGKPTFFFLSGEYGIGKSSLADYVQRVAVERHGLQPVSVRLGGVRTVKEFCERLVRACFDASSGDPRVVDRLKRGFPKLFREVSLFGVKLNLDALRAEVPEVDSPKSALAFLQGYLKQLGSEAKGVLIVLDELNGIASNADFAAFLKTMVDDNAQLNPPVPLMLLLCGTPERRREFVKAYPSVDRIFDVVTVEKMSDEESEEFFRGTFESAEIEVDPYTDLASDLSAMNLLVISSEGLPKVMQMLGNNVFFMDSDGFVDMDDVGRAYDETVEEFGAKFVDDQIVKAIQSPDCRAILSKLTGFVNSEFTRDQLAAKLEPSEAAKLTAFLKRMRDLNVLRSTDKKGGYAFNIDMVATYISMSARLDRS